MGDVKETDIDDIGVKWVTDDPPTVSTRPAVKPPSLSFGGPRRHPYPSGV